MRTVNSSSKIGAKHPHAYRLMRYVLPFTALLLVCLALISCNFFSSESKPTFEIEDGTLIRYNGEDAVVVLPNEVEVIGTDAFADCGHVTEVTLPIRLTAIQSAAFAGCTETRWVVSATHPTFYIDNGNLMRRADKYLILASRDGALPADSGGVAEGAYANLAADVKVILPASVTSVSAALFKGCVATSIVIPDTVTSIRVGAFNGLPVTHLTLPFLGTEPGQSDACFGDIFGKEGSLFSHTADARDNRIPNHITHVTLTGGRLGANAFRGCSSLTRIDICDGVTGVIRAKTFSGTRALKDLYLGRGIEALETDALTSTGVLLSSYALHYAGSSDEWDALEKPTDLLQNWWGTTKPNAITYNDPPSF